MTTEKNLISGIEGIISFYMPKKILTSIYQLITTPLKLIMSFSLLSTQPE